MKVTVRERPRRRWWMRVVWARFVTVTSHATDGANVKQPPTNTPTDHPMHRATPDMPLTPTSTNPFTRGASSRSTIAPQITRVNRGR
jgi:hypothetical protein